MTDDLSRLEADSDVCMAFLIAHQDEWGPEVELLDRRSVPMTLIAGDRR